MTLSDDVRDYWNTRAEGYSLHNCDELDGGTGLVLEHLFRTELGAKPGMRALDAGCGPDLQHRAGETRLQGDGHGPVARDARARGGEREEPRA